MAQREITIDQLMYLVEPNYMSYSGCYDKVMNFLILKEEKEYSLQYDMRLDKRRLFDNEGEIHILPYTL